MINVRVKNMAPIKVDVGSIVKGDPGPKGPIGPQGEKGEPGKEGKTPTKGIDYWTDQDKEQIVADTASRVLNSEKSKEWDRKIAIVITREPKDVYAEYDTRIYFSAEADGTDLQYQWQYQIENTDNWSNWTSKKTSASNLDVTEYYKNAKIRCKITDKYGNEAYTNPFTLNIGKSPIEELQNNSLVIIKQPENVYGNLGDAVSIEVKAIGIDLKYQWYYQQNGIWNKLTSWDGCYTEKITIPSITATRATYNYSCTITDKFGNSVTTAEANVIIGKAPNVTINDIATATDFGVIKVGTGLTANEGTLRVTVSGSDSYKKATSNNAVIISRENEAAFYGLAKAAGDTSQQNSDNGVGKYTPEAMKLIREMLGIVELTQKEYDLIESKSESTIYVIVG